jgi:hypothetical protein
MALQAYAWFARAGFFVSVRQLAVTTDDDEYYVYAIAL